MYRLHGLPNRKAKPWILDSHDAGSDPRSSYDKHHDLQRVEDDKYVQKTKGHGRTGSAPSLILAYAT